MPASTRERTKPEETITEGKPIFEPSRWEKVKGRWRRGLRDLIHPEDSGEILRERLEYKAPTTIPRTLRWLRAVNQRRNIGIYEYMLREMGRPEIKRRIRNGLEPYAFGADWVDKAPEIGGKLVRMSVFAPAPVSEMIGQTVERGYRQFVYSVNRGLNYAKHQMNTYPGMMLGLGTAGAFVGHKIGFDPAAVGMLSAAGAGGARLVYRGGDELGHKWRFVRPRRFYTNGQLDRLASFNAVDPEAGRELARQLPEMLKANIAERQAYRNALLQAMEASRFRKIRLSTQTKIGNLFKRRKKE